MNESQLRNKVKLALSKTKWYYQKISDRFTAGIPDYIMCINGRFLSLELKVDERNMTPLQSYTRDRIENAGGYYLCLKYLNSNKTYEVDWKAKTLQPIQTFDSLEAVLDFIRGLCESESQTWGFSHL